MSGDYAPQMIDGKMCVWLQAIGFHAAKPLGDVVAGDVIVYNYGGTATVESVERSKLGGSIVLTVIEKGERFVGRARRASTFIAVKGV